MSSQLPLDQPARVFKIAFVTSLVTFVLTLSVLLIGILHLASMPRGGIAGFAAIAVGKIYSSLIFVLGVISLAAGVYAAVGLRLARWYLAGILTVAAVWVLIAKPWDSPNSDAAGLIQRLGKDRGDDWERDVTWLADLGEKSAPALAQALQHNNSKVRLGAVKALERMAFRNKAAIPELVRALEDEDDQIRIAAASAFGWFWKRNDARLAKIAIPGLAKSIHDDNWEVRFKSSYALMQIADGVREDASAAVPALIRCLERERNEAILEYAARALAYIGPPAKAALPALEAIPQKDHLGLSVLLAIWKISREDEPTVTRTMGFLQHESDYVRTHAARVLGEIGPPAAKALPALRNLSAKTGVQTYADAIKKIAPNN